MTKPKVSEEVFNATFDLLKASLEGTGTISPEDFSEHAHVEFEDPRDQRRWIRARTARVAEQLSSKIDAAIGSALPPDPEE